MKGIRSRLKRLEDERSDRFEERCRGCGEGARIVFEEHKDGQVIFNGFKPCPLCHELEAYRSGPPFRVILICHDRGLGRHCRFCSGELDSWSVGPKGESKENGG